jgi:hypothetical protein
MLNQKTNATKVGNKDDSSRKPKNIEELRQMAKAKIAKKKATKKPASKAKKK